LVVAIKKVDFMERKFHSVNMGTVVRRLEMILRHVEPW
jgi:hypothetical protein